MLRLALSMAIGLGATIAAAVVLAIFVAIGHIWLAGNGRTSWVDLPRNFPVIGETTALDLFFVVTTLTIGIVSMITAWRINR